MLISCFPNLPHVYIMLCKHRNHFTFLHYVVNVKGICHLIVVQNFYHLWWIKSHNFLRTLIVKKTLFQRSLLNLAKGEQKLWRNFGITKKGYHFVEINLTWTSQFFVFHFTIYAKLCSWKNCLVLWGTFKIIRCCSALKSYYESSYKSLLEIKLISSTTWVPPEHSSKQV